MEIVINLPGERLGVLEIDGACVRPADDELGELMNEVCERKRLEFTVETLAESDAVRAVRGMFREWGIDPSKYRPSSEALLRRVVQGKGVYRVLNAVDIGNLCSIETGWPLGCYDRSKLRPPVALRHGAPGEVYEGIGKRTWHLEGRPVLADHAGPFGSPISDSTRSMITEETREILIVIYVPASAPIASVEEALDKLAERFTRFAAARGTECNICS
jgi:DNA/RNA-binding domain of Phe-tRNA-synthetase-like protein